MKQLSEVLKDTLNTAKKTEYALVERKSSSISVDTKTITAEVERYKGELPQTQVERGLELLTSLGNLSKNPVIEKETVFTEYGATFVPVDIHFGKLDDNQKAIALEITKKLCEPISKNEFGLLYAKMRLLCVRKDVDVDEKMAMYCPSI